MLGEENFWWHRAAVERKEKKAWVVGFSFSSSLGASAERSKAFTLMMTGWLLLPTLLDVCKFDFNWKKLIYNWHCFFLFVRSRVKVPWRSLIFFSSLGASVERSKDFTLMMAAWLLLPTLLDVYKFDFKEEIDLVRAAYINKGIKTSVFQMSDSHNQSLK